MTCLEATSAPEVGASYGIPAPVRPFLEEVGANPGNLKIAFFTKIADEATLYRLAGQLEKAKPWREKIPSMAT